MGPKTHIIKLNLTINKNEYIHKLRYLEREYRQKRQRVFKTPKSNDKSFWRGRGGGTRARRRPSEGSDWVSLSSRTTTSKSQTGCSSCAGAGTRLERRTGRSAAPPRRSLVASAFDFIDEDRTSYLVTTLFWGGEIVEGVAHGTINRLHILPPPKEFGSSGSSH